MPNAEDRTNKAKDVAAIGWVRNASSLAKLNWKYLKVPQKEFQALQPSALADLPLGRL